MTASSRLFNSFCCTRFTDVVVCTAACINQRIMKRLNRDNRAHIAVAARQSVTYCGRQIAPVPSAPFSVIWCACLTRACASTFRREWVPRS